MAKRGALLMIACRAHLPNDFLDLVARRIINEVDGIWRVTAAIPGKAPAAIEWESARVVLATTTRECRPRLTLA